MSDETGLWKVAVSALIDVFMAEGAKRKRWIRILNALGTLLFTVLIGALYLRYSPVFVSRTSGTVAYPG